MAICRLPEEEISAVSSRLDDDTSCTEADTIVTRASKPRQAKAVAKKADPSPDTTCNDTIPPPPPKKTRNESQVRNLKYVVKLDSAIGIFMRYILR